jgi:hypothetical protein
MKYRTSLNEWDKTVIKWLWKEGCCLCSRVSLRTHSWNYIVLFICLRTSMLYAQLNLLNNKYGLQICILLSWVYGKEVVAFRLLYLWVLLLGCSYFSFIFIAKLTILMVWKYFRTINATISTIIIWFNKKLTILIAIGSHYWITRI